MALLAVIRAVAILAVIVDSRSRAWFGRKPYNTSLGANVVALAGKEFSAACSFGSAFSQSVGLSI